jgi:hypothetical protein
MKKLLTALALVVMLTAGTGVVGASEIKTGDSTISVVESSFSTLSKRPINMD